VITVTRYRWTLDRYHAAIDAGLFEDQAVELLRGDLVIMAPERESHACYSRVGADYLRRCLGQRGAVRETKPITLPNQEEYWVVDPKHRHLKVFRDLAKGQYQTELTLTEGCLSPALVQDVVIEGRRLYR